MFQFNAPGEYTVVCCPATMGSTGVGYPYIPPQLERKERWLRLPDLPQLRQFRNDDERSAFESIAELQDSIGISPSISKYFGQRGLRPEFPGGGT